MLKACRELGVAFVAFSPVARGFLCGEMDVNALDAKNIRRSMPRFAPENYAANLKIFLVYHRRLRRRRAARSPNFSPDVLARLDTLINKKTIQGSRCNAQGNQEVDTEVF